MEMFSFSLLLGILAQSWTDSSLKVIKISCYFCYVPENPANNNFAINCEHYKLIGAYPSVGVGCGSLAQVSIVSGSVDPASSFIIRASAPPIAMLIPAFLTSRILTLLR